MAYYLQMDGVDDRLFFNEASLNATEFVVDFKPRIKAWAPYVFFGGKSINANGIAAADLYHADFQNVYVDGVPVTNNTKFIKDNVRQVLRGILKSGISTGSERLSFFWNNATAYVEGEIYNIKVYRDGLLVAHYDMTLGNVQDQSGNGRHATLTGGTWVQDGGGGTTHALASSANGVSVATTALTVIPAAIQLAASATGVGQGVANLSVLNASMLLSANAPGVSQGSASMSVILGLASSKSGVAWGSASLAGLTIQLSASANGAAVGYASLISGANIVGFIRLEGKQVLSINLVGERDLHAAVVGAMNPPSVALGGVL